MNIRDSNYPVAVNIICIMKEKGLKQKSVAVKAGFTPKDFNSMLRGRKLIKACDITPIANALDVTINELYGRWK